MNTWNSGIMLWCFSLGVALLLYGGRYEANILLNERGVPALNSVVVLKTYILSPIISLRASESDDRLHHILGRNLIKLHISWE